MNYTSIIVLTLGLTLAGAGALQAQSRSLRDATVPAEFPPASFKGKQYVDSLGCIFIRAGIDGNVTWVPRVNRNRKQVCGFKPTLPPGASAGVVAPRPAKPPVQITNEPTPEPAPRRAGAPTVEPTVQPTPEPTVQPTPKPAPRTARTGPGRPLAVLRPRPVAQSGAAQPRPVPKTPISPVAAVPVVAPVAVPVTIARPDPPVRPAAIFGRNKPAAAPLPPGTRVVPRHVYDNRRNTTNFTVPKGYRAAWDDDRLNPKRAETSLRPGDPNRVVVVPRNYRAAWDDGRLNPGRGLRTASGDAQSDLIWTRTVPRRLVPASTQGRIVTVPVRNPASGRLFRSRQQVELTVTRISTRSGPNPGVKPRRPEPSR